MGKSDPQCLSQGDHIGLVAAMRRDPQSDGITGCARTLYCLGRGVSLINKRGSFLPGPKGSQVLHPAGPVQ